MAYLPKKVFHWMFVHRIIASDVHWEANTHSYHEMVFNKKCMFGQLVCWEMCQKVFQQKIWFSEYKHSRSLYLWFSQLVLVLSYLLPAKECNSLSLILEFASEHIRVEGHLPLTIYQSIKLTESRFSILVIVRNSSWRSCHLCEKVTYNDDYAMQAPPSLSELAFIGNDIVLH